MSHCHDLHRVGDDLATGQRILHALVIHGQTIANPDSPKGDWGAPGNTNPGFNRLQNLVKMHMTGDNLTVRVGNPDQRAPDFLVGIAHGLQQRAMWRPLHPFA